MHDCAALLDKIRLVCFLCFTVRVSLVLCSVGYDIDDPTQPIGSGLARNKFVVIRMSSLVFRFKKINDNNYELNVEMNTKH
jgi:hypothetical protein